MEMAIESYLEAAKSGDLTTIKAILDARPNLVNVRDSDGRQSTALHFASGMPKTNAFT